MVVIIPTTGVVGGQQVGLALREPDACCGALVPRAVAIAAAVIMQELASICPLLISFTRSMTHSARGCS